MHSNRILRSLALTSLCALAFAPGSFAQYQAAPGFEHSGNLTVPLFSVQVTQSNDHYVQFDGQFFGLHRPDGTPVLDLGSLPGSVFASFAELDPSESFAIVGESSNGDLFKVDLSPGGSATAFANLTFNFDAVFDADPAYLIVSAALGGFGAGNDIVRVELASGAQTLLAHVDGPSGPLAIDASGNVYYGTQSAAFPPPPGSADVIMWTQAQLQGGVLLGAADAAVSVASLDGVSGLAFDPATGHLLVSGSNLGIHVVRSYTPAGIPIETIFETPATFIAGLELLTQGGAASFQSFQPENVRLRLRSTDFSSISDYLTIEPQRPVGELFGPAAGTGIMALRFTDAPPTAQIHVMMGDVNMMLPNEETYHFSNWLAPFHSALFVADWTRRFKITTDANGVGIFHYVDPGNLAGTLVFQGVLHNAFDMPVGSSAPLLN